MSSSESYLRFTAAFIIDDTFSHIRNYIQLYQIDIFKCIRNFQKEYEEIHKDVAKILNCLLNFINY